MNMMNTITSKDEQFVIVNDQDSGIIIFSTETNMKCLCNDITEIFIDHVDGTFKCCPRYFYQLYSIHGGKNGNYVPLVYSLLPAKSEACYQQMWSLLLGYCASKRLQLSPQTIHVDFEIAMHNAVEALLKSLSAS